MQCRQQRLRQHQRTVRQHLHGHRVLPGVADVAGQFGRIAAAHDADVLVELVGFAVVEDLQHARRISGRHHAFGESGHDLARGLAVHFAVEGDHAAEGRPGIGVARLAIDAPQRFRAHADRRAGGFTCFITAQALRSKNFTMLSA